MDSLSNKINAEKTLVLYFQVHQPRRLHNLRFFDIGSGAALFDDELNRSIIQRVARECYLPTNNLLLDLIKAHPGIRLSFSLSGVLMEQLERHAPEVLDTFRQLARTGSVEFLCETYHHSLACMIPGREFEEQVMQHAEKLYECVGVRPCAFRNTELIYNDEIGLRINNLGFSGVIIDGVSRIPGLTNVNQLFHHPNDRHFKILTRNYHLSDAVGFRYIEMGKKLTSDSYISSLLSTPPFDQVVTLGLDYETFGEHQKHETGILSFLKETLTTVAHTPGLRMATASMAMVGLKARGAVSVPHFISWADNERDLSAWLGNDMQRDAFDSLLALECDVKNSGEGSVIDEWRNLQTSDHFYYMSTKKGSDGTIHNYFSPYSSPYEAFINYMNVITDFSTRVKILTAGQHALVDILAHPASENTSSRMTMLVQQ